MKKSLWIRGNAILLSFAIVIATITPSLHAEKMGPKRFVQCLFQPGKYSCSHEEKTKARKWITSAVATAAAVIAAAAAIGISLSRNDVKEMKEEAKKELTEEQKAYETLGISSSATPAEIRKAYRQMSLKWHPDKAPAGKQAEYTVKQQEINRAYEILTK